MEKEENIFADAEREGQTLEEFLDQHEDSAKEEVPQESQAEKTEEKKVEKPKEEPEPDLKKNQTWKEMREENERKEKALEELNARLAELEKQTKVEKLEQPAFLTDMIGENEDVARKYQEHERSIIERAKKEFLEEQRKEAEHKKAESEKWIKWTADRLQEVEKEYNVDFKANESLKNELSKVMIKYSPSDEHGNLDYRKGMEILNDLKKVSVEVETQKTEAKKKIADATVSKETNARQSKEYMTSNDFRNRGWRSLIK